MKVTREMIRHQGALLARSAREIWRDPASGRGFLRLLGTRGRSTMTLRLPWLPFRLIDELSAKVGPDARVFEYGGGGSTLWFLDRGASVVTVEHDRDWARALSDAVPADRWELLERSSDNAFEDYVSAILAFPDHAFDVVVVDGRERGRCLLAAVEKVRPGGLLILDDSDRARYAAAMDQVDWPRREVVGFAPAKPTLAYSTVFTRPEG